MIQIPEPPIYLQPTNTFKIDQVKEFGKQPTSNKSFERKRR